MSDPDVVVVGSGPNGLAAAVTCARAGLSVTVLEAQDAIGGGARTAELTLPGFHHDVCSAVHPAALASPFLRAFGIRERIAWRIPEVSYAHAMPDGPAVLAWRDLDRTVAELGAPALGGGPADAASWRRVLGPLSDRVDAVTRVAFDTLLRVPAHPVDELRLGLRALAQTPSDRGTPSQPLALRGTRARALFAGVAAHVAGRRPSLAATAAGLVLAAQGHGAGWGVPVGGSQAIADALTRDLVAHGGRTVTGHPVRAAADLPRARAVLFDTSPRVLADVLGDRLPTGYRRALVRHRYGPGAAKLDLALDGPVPWRDPRLALAPTVHIGGTAEAIAAAEDATARAPWFAPPPEHPYLLVVQPGVVDDTRAPAGAQTLWAYLHVPAGSPLDPTEPILRRLEAYAPGLRDRVLGAHARSAAELARTNPNDVGGDISGGAVTMWRMLARPVLSPRPWATPVPGVYLCSAATPPGPAVHGMSGWLAARLALRDRFGVVALPDLGPDIP